VLNRPQRRLLLSGAVLVAGLVLSRRLPPPLIAPASLVWWVALIVFVATGWRVLSAWMGKTGATVVVLIGLALPVALTAYRFAPEPATRLPCPRNWLWRPAWQLRSSPLESAQVDLPGGRLRICYGRPALRGRTMLGGRHVPFGQLWRTGANEPTTLITTVPLEVAGITIPAGRTALYTVPGPESWEIILNRNTSQWGIESEYTESVRAGEIGRAIVRSRPIGGARLERLTFDFTPVTGDSTALVLAWGVTRVRIPVRVAPR
jgi:hypothetical protein